MDSLFTYWYVFPIAIGLFTEIFGFTSSFFGFWRAKLIDYRISIFSIMVGVPLAVAGGLMTYVLPPQGLLLVVCASLPILSYLIYLGPSQVERVAIGTSHMVIMIVAFAAVAPHIYKALAGGSIPWQIIAMTIPAVLIGGQIAPKVTGLLPQPVLKRALATILLILCLITAYRIFAMTSGH